MVKGTIDEKNTPVFSWQLNPIIDDYKSYYLLAI